jgi:hypothetical protein
LKLVIVLLLLELFVIVFDGPEGGLGKNHSYQAADASSIVKFKRVPNADLRFSPAPD